MNGRNLKEEGREGGGGATLRAWLGRGSGSGWGGLGRGRRNLVLAMVVGVGVWPV